MALETYHPATSRQTNFLKLIGQLTSLPKEFEAATDPVYPTGYTTYGGTPGAHGEIGDKCKNMYDPLNYDNGQANQVWNNHFYIIQEMWDNNTASCSQG